jgi:hypothetical protein
MNLIAITVKDWMLINPEMPLEYNILEFSLKCRNILDKGLYVENADLYLIERQSWRPGFKQSIPMAILRSNAFEAILMGTLLERGKHKQLPVISVLPSILF